MDFMNLNQAAHGDREFGFIAARMRLERKVVVGHWSDPEVQGEIGSWARAAAAKRDWETGRIARFGDNMRDVAVTEGDKVEAQRRLGFSVNTYGVGDLVGTRGRGDRRRGRRAHRRRTSTSTTSRRSCRPGAPCAGSLRDGARIELGLRAFLVDGGFTAFTTTFEDLHGLTQLPGPRRSSGSCATATGSARRATGRPPSMVRAMKVMTERTARRRLLHGGLHLPPRPDAAT